MTAQVVGIDIGSGSVRAVELSHSGRETPDIVRLAEVPLSNGAVHRGEVIEVATVAAAIKRLWVSGGFTTKDVILGMGGSRVISRDMTMPRAPLAQIKDSLPFHVGDMLPVPVNEALLDFYPISEETRESGPVVKGLVIAVVKEAVTTNIAAITEAGLRTVEVDVTPFALARALAPIRSSHGLAVIVSVGANSTNVIVVMDGVPQFIRIIAGGGEDITSALSTQLQVSRARAEEIKREIGLGTPATLPEQRAAVGIVQEAANPVLVSLRDTLSYYLQSHAGVEFDRVILSGGGSHLPGLLNALRQVTGVPVVQAVAISQAQLPKSLKRSATRENVEAMTTAYGLAMGTTL